LLNNAATDIKISIKIFDQNPVIRKDLFQDIPSCIYEHLFWDWQNSPTLYKNRSINLAKEDYILILSDNVLLSSGWDKKVLDFIEDNNVVVSGSGPIKIEQKNNFYIKKELGISNNFIKNNFIDRSFIFAKTKTLKEKTKYPRYIKYNGEEEIISAELFTNGIDIFSAPSDTYSTIGDSTLESLYVPFSLNHNYNSAIELFKTGKNSFISLLDGVRSIDEFNKYHNDVFLTLFPLPFHTNDVEYNPLKLNFQSVDARKFVARTKAIH
jgi:hypothetical protein